MNATLNRYIGADPKVQVGKAIIKGTRVPVELIVGKIAGGMTMEEVMHEYDLTRAQVQAALRYAGDLVREESLMRV